MKNKDLKILSSFKSLTVNESDDSLKITGIANAQTVDRDGDIIIEDAYKKGGLDNYLKNPILLFNHSYDQPIGKTTALSVGPEGLSITASISKAAGRVYDLIKDEIIKAFSIGFRVKDAEYDSTADVLKITDIELYEISAVAVPANADSIFSLQKQLTEYKDEYKKQFALKSAKQDVVPEVNAPESTEKSVLDAKLEEKRMSDELKAELAKIKAEKEKMAADLAAAESLVEEAAKAEQERVAKEKEAAARIEVKSQMEEFAKDLEAKFAEKNESIKETVKSLEAELKEKGEELKKFQDNKMRFQQDTGGNVDVTKTEKEDAVLISKLLGKDIQNTKFYQDLVQKSGLQHAPAQQWEEEFNYNIFNKMKEKLVVEPLFQTIQMNAPLMNIPTNPEAGDAQWISSAADPYLNQRSTNNASTGTAVDHKLGEVTLQAYKLAAKEYIGYEEEEDTLLPILPIVRDAITRRMARTTDQSLLRGTGTGTGGDAVSPFKGLTTKAVDASANNTTVAVASKWTVDNLQAVRRDLGVWGLNPGEVKYIVSPDVYYDLLEDADFRTIDMVGDRATIITGQIGFINGSVVLVSDSFEAKAATKACVVAVYTGNFFVGNLRNMMIERDTNIEDQRRIIVATRRLGFVDIEASKGVSVGTWVA